MLELLRYVNQRIDEVMEGIYETDAILRCEEGNFGDPDVYREADESQMKLNGQLEELQKMKKEIELKVGLK